MMMLATAASAFVGPTPRCVAVRTGPPKAVFGKLFGVGAVNGASALEEELFKRIDTGGTMRDALDDFERLEAAAPSANNLLSSEAGTKLLDGRWLLRSTIAAEVGGDESLASGGVSNAVNASGIVVDASAARVPVQEIDVTAARVGNEIRFNAPLGSELILRVAGGFEADPIVGRRALVNFDTLDVFLLFDGGNARRILRAGGLFSLVRALRPALASGSDDQPWLDTTYISKRCRLGRGNKVSFFSYRFLALKLLLSRQLTLAHTLRALCIRYHRVRCLSWNDALRTRSGRYLRSHCDASRGAERAWHASFPSRRVPRLGRWMGRGRGVSSASCK